MINTQLFPRNFYGKGGTEYYILKDALKESRRNGYTLLHKGYAAHFIFMSL